jgi:hypothetical protein
MAAKNNLFFYFFILRRVNEQVQNELKCLKDGSLEGIKVQFCSAVVFYLNFLFVKNTGHKINSLLSANCFDRVVQIFTCSIKVGDAVRHKRNAVRHERNASRHKRNASRHKRNAPRHIE